MHEGIHMPRAGFRWGLRGHGPQAFHHRGAYHQTPHRPILFLANESADDFFIDALLQFASVTMY